MRPGTLYLSRKNAEKMFKRKASPDAMLTPKAFINKKVKQPAVRFAKSYGRNVMGGARMVGSGMKKMMRKMK